MRNQFLKALEWKQQKPSFSAARIEDWILPSWFIKQSDFLNPGYVFGKYQFANICFRNWTAFCNYKGQPVLFIDGEGTVSFPHIGVSVEIWVNNGKVLITPGKFLQTRVTVDPDFPSIETINSFKEGVLKSRVFPILGLQEAWIGLELNLYAAGESAFNDFLLCLVVRPYDNNGLTRIKKLEYRNKSIKVNYNELLQLEIEPKIIFCTHAGLGDVTDYFKLEENKHAVTSPDGSCTGLIGYSIRPADRTGIRLILKPESLKFFPNQVREFPQSWLWESKQIWVNRYSRQHHMLITGSPIDQICRASLNFLMMFHGRSSGLVDIETILVLNRFAFYSESRSYLIKTLKKVRWDGSISNKPLNPGKLIYAIGDYYQLSGDCNLVRENWQTLKRIGYWLAQNQTFFKGDDLPEHTEDPAWTCASFKVLSRLSQVNDDYQSGQFFHHQYQGLWSRILEVFSRGIKKGYCNGYRKRFPISESIRRLAISYPLRLYRRNERFIREWLDQILETSTFNGGVVSPLEFQGIDLELTARLGMILLREEGEYDRVFKFLIEAISSTGNWPDRVHPIFGGGIGVKGHSLEVSCLFLLILRNAMVMEEGEVLYLLPGIITSKLWNELNIELKNLPTAFGDISLQCRNIGKIVQLEFKASFRRKPRCIRLILNQRDRLLYSDSVVMREGEYVKLDSGFKIVRFSRFRS